MHTLCNSLQHALKFLSLLCVHRLSDNGFQRRVSRNSVFMVSYPCWLLPISLQLPSWLPTSDLSTQLDSTTLTPRLTAISHKIPTLLTVVSRPSRNCSCFSLLSLGTDHIENTFPKVVLLRQVVITQTAKRTSPPSYYIVAFYESVAALT
jgi:hypothetical protein